MTHCQFTTDARDPRRKRCARKGCGRELVTDKPPERCIAPCRSSVPQTTGAGTFLSRSLALWNLRHCEACDCATKAAVMDRMGWQWCRKHAATIVGWLRENAAKCGYPYVESVAYIFVRSAIAKARRAAQKGTVA